MPKDKRTYTELKDIGGGKVTTPKKPNTLSNPKKTPENAQGGGKNIGPKRPPKK